MYWVIIGIIILVCVLLIILILLQNSKGGLASGVASTQLMGVKRTTDILEKLTWGFAIAIMVLVVSTAFVAPTVSTESGAGSVNIKKAQEKSAPRQAAPAPVNPQPTVPAQTDSTK
jgi:preprotein translocase subunit SecG